MPREAYRWPSHRNKDRKRCLELLSEAAARQKRGIEAVYQQRAPDVAAADLWPVANAIAEVRRMLTEAAAGAPDDLAAALELVRELTASEFRSTDLLDRAGKLLARYED